MHNAFEIFNKSVNPIKANLTYLLGRLKDIKPEYLKTIYDKATKISFSEKIQFLKDVLGRDLCADVIQIHPKTLD